MKCLVMLSIISTFVCFYSTYINIFDIYYDEGAFVNV